MLFKRHINVCKISRYYSNTSAADKKKLYSNTINLPQTKLPLRLSSKAAEERDTEINNSNAFRNLYEWQRNNLSGTEFILHDGPPYANGMPHMGHAINKILKDAIIRHKILQGNKVHYIPGWDCHGLPIELKALAKNTGKLSPQEIRSKARKFASDTVENQKEAFLSWGVIGDWNNAYTTYNTQYIENQIRQFYKLYEAGLAFRDVKPVYWSPSSRTALAEAELEYNPSHKSPAITLRLLVNSTSLPDMLQKYKSQRIYALIWTTTPWTLPSNQAVCFNADSSYSFIQDEKDGPIYIVATDLIHSISKTLNRTFNILESIPGTCLKDLIYTHPIYKDKKLPFLHSPHTAIKGTGLVHTAPAHGPEDFLVALSHKLSIICMVDEAGCYTPDVGDDLKGKFVLKEGNETILKLVESDILKKEQYVHSYPYDWRTKKPVILRASKQWFINTDAIKDKAIELLDNVKFLPKVSSEIYKKNLIDQLRKRPYWCISRQRIWGVPIPAFYEKDSGKVIINEQTISYIIDLQKKHGTDYWWTLSLEELFPKDVLHKFNLSIDNIEKGQDIFDIWYDSGMSWSGVLEGEQVADMYLEGVDQFTGWFQSSLLTSVALRDKAPYKCVYVHGFAVDEKGNKMSKSIGNVIDPSDIVKGSKGKKGYGVDALRWWVVCHANQDSLASVSPNVLQASADEVQKIRSVLRFALGALHDYKNDLVDYKSLTLTDKFILHVLWNFHNQVSLVMKNHNFNISISLNNLLTNTVSSLYYTTIKDRLYCDSADSDRRLSAQYVLLQIFNVVSQIVAPIVPHLVEELYQHLPQKTTDSFFTRKQLVDNSNWNNNSVCNLMNLILDIKKIINKEYGPSTLGISVNIKAGKDFYKSLTECASKEVQQLELADIFNVATVNIEEDVQVPEYICTTEKSHMHLCNRCRRIASNVEDELCNRCSLVIEHSNKTRAVS